MLKNRAQPARLQQAHRLSLLLSTAAVLLFIITRQSYAAAFAFVFLLIKALMLLKHP